jgi:RHS repeat-associated protein
VTTRPGAERTGPSDAYGKTLYRTGTTDTPYLYVGQFGVQTDPTGLHYMRARYYNPILMRFINADPIGFAGGSNWYAYAGNSPLMFVDPSGFCRDSSGGGSWLDGGSWQRQAGSALAGFIPYVGTALSVVEFVSGNDYISGEETSRILALAGLIPFAKGTIKSGKIAIKNSDVIAKGAKSAWQWTADTATSAWGKGVGKSAAQNIAPRALTQADLGIKGTMREVRGTFSMTNNVATVRVDMISGNIENPLQIIPNLSATARANGATTLRIEGTVANEKLYNILIKRYGMKTNGATDIIEIPLQ